MIAPADKLFKEKEVKYFNIYDRERIFTIVYSTPKATFIKRFAFGGAIMNRDYFCAVGCTKIHQIWDLPVNKVRLKYRQGKGARVSEQTFPLKDQQDRGPKAPNSKFRT